MIQDDPATVPHSEFTPPHSPKGGSRELLVLALPLILSQSFFTLQVAIDRVLLSRYDANAVAASFPATMLFWLPFALLQTTSGYVSTFVAQYTGAGRPGRVGPAVWQGLYFAVGSGVLFLAIIPAAPYLVALGEHSPALQALETTYLQYLGLAGPPMLIVAAVNGFFSGRGDTWTVLLIDAVGSVANAGLALLLIFGTHGFPELGIAGAGIATAVGASVSAACGMAMLLRKRYRDEFQTWSGRKFEPDLFVRLLKFGGPAGVQMMLDVLAFTLFTLLVGRLGDAAMGATSLTVTLNMIAFLPMMGLGQAVCVLVGRRLGEDDPGTAERTTYTGAKWSFGYMCCVAALYVFAPHLLLAAFEGERDPEKFAAVAAMVPTLLLFCAAFSLTDSINTIFSFALRGAGDTKYVTALTFALAWPIMVIPTFVVVNAGGSLYWCWAFASTHIAAMAVCFYLRFRTGKWKTMRVIEAAPEAG